MNPFPIETGSEGTSFGLKYPFPVKIKTEREESPRMLPQGGFQAAKVIMYMCEYSRSSLIRTLWDQGSFRLVKNSD